MASSQKPQHNCTNAVLPPSVEEEGTLENKKCLDVEEIDRRLV
jgi:hypothetical protein